MTQSGKKVKWYDLVNSNFGLALLIQGGYFMTLPLILIGEIK